MSNVKVIPVGLADGWETFSPTAIWLAKKARASGRRHGQSQTLVVDDVQYRVLLDDHTGDKVYVSGPVCPMVTYSGFLDTYSAWSSYLLGGPPIRVKEVQEDDEDLPRTRSGVYIEGNPVMSGMRGAVPVGTGYPLVKVPRQDSDDDFRKFFAEHKPSKYSGLMRRMLQATFGTRSWRVLTYRTAPAAPLKFRFNYQWGDSWGLILSPGKDGSSGSHYFLIHVANSEVRWIPAKICVHKMSGGEFVPVLRSVDQTGAVSLGVADGLKGTSWSAALGWAFSYKTPVLSAVTYEINDERYMTYRTDISVKFSGGIPSGIGVSCSSGSIFWNHHRTDNNTIVATPVGVFNVPKNDGSSIITVDIHNHPAPSMPTYRADAIPVHIYYVPDESVPVVVTYSYEKFTSSYEDMPGHTSAPDAFSRPAGVRSEGGHTKWGFSVNGSSIAGSKGAKADAYVEYRLAGPCLPFYFGDGSYQVLSDVVFANQTYKKLGYAPVNLIGVYSNDPTSCSIDSGTYTVPDPTSNVTNYKSYEVGQGVFKSTMHPTAYFIATQQTLSQYVHMVTTTASGGEVTLMGTCTIPCGDRESVLLYSSRSEAALTDTEAVQVLTTRYYDPSGPYIFQSTWGGFNGLSTDISEYLSSEPVSKTAKGIRAILMSLQQSFYARPDIPKCDFIINCAYKVSEAGVPHSGQYSWPFAIFYLRPAIVAVDTTFCPAYPDGYAIYQEGASYDQYPIPTVIKSHGGKFSEQVVLYSGLKAIKLYAPAWAYSLLRVWDYRDNWVVQHSRAAWAGGVAFDKTPAASVVHIGNSEYNVTKFVNGWIGVV